MAYIIAIRKNDTGEIHYYTDTFTYEDEYHMLWQYTEGNFGCDCNRELFWYRLIGIEKIGEKLKCTDDRFSIVYIERPDGTRITEKEIEEY